MTIFSVNRKTQNRGCGDRSGRKTGTWLFEEFMITDSVFGRAVVEYGFASHRIPVCDRDPMKMGGVPLYECEVFNPVVVEAIVFDDEGTPIPISAADNKELRRLVLEAFWNQERDVIDFEGGLR